MIGFKQDLKSRPYYLYTQITEQNVYSESSILTLVWSRTDRTSYRSPAVAGGLPGIYELK